MQSVYGWTAEFAGDQAQENFMGGGGVIDLDTVQGARYPPERQVEHFDLQGLES
ncbi:hypothetical protein [Deinococcus hopiensis]|uniref:hypothetical protein n=1 Tax=Deinococcus hopiensis TaxID=309885 RepID=UPI0014823A06|nr:hypothetical protein [Deinococcus hopiensis]